MGQNYNLNANFGFNVTNKKIKTAETEKQTLEQQKKEFNIFTPISDYFNKYEDVLNGNTEKEINMYSRQAMIVGMNLKASDKTLRKFDMNI